MNLSAWLDRLMEMYASRAAGAVFLAILVAFAAHAATAPNRLPPFGTLGLVEIGLVDPSLALPAPVDAETLDIITEEVSEARSTAKPFLQEWLEANPAWVTRINFSGAVIALALLLGSLGARTMREPKIRAV